MNIHMCIHMEHVLGNSMYYDYLASVYILFDSFHSNFTFKLTVFNKFVILHRSLSAA